jgi:TPR repeat protein
LGGTGGSQTVSAYLHQFVFAERLSLAQRGVGAWAGLRFGWILVAVAVLGLWRNPSRPRPLGALWLGGGIALTALIGLFTALDLGRSMVLIFPVVPLGWFFAIRTRWWRQARAGPLIAAAAWLLPASHVVGKYLRPVDNLWSPPQPLLIAENELGLMYGDGRAVPRDDAKAVRWYRKAAQAGLPEAEYNLGVMYARGSGVPPDRAQAIRWFRRAAEQDFAKAEYNLGMIYVRGELGSGEGAEARKWLEKAARQGEPEALYNLGVMYASGSGVTKDGAAALRWYRRAIAAGSAQAANNLGVMYASGNGVSRDEVEACRWFLIGQAMGSAEAGKNLGILSPALTPEQLGAAAALARRREPAPPP